MRNALVKLLTRRTAAHQAIATLAQWRLHLQGWRDARAALRARKASR